MRACFGAIAFNQPLTFDTSPGDGYGHMFQGATAMTYPRPRVVDSSSEEDDEEDSSSDGRRGR